MRLRLKDARLVESEKELWGIPEGKISVHCLNAYSYNIAQKDSQFAEALLNGNFLIPDGASIVMACRWLKAKSRPEKRIAGWDLFSFEMDRLERKSEKREAESEKLRVMFIGSSEKVLNLIRERASREYPCLDIITYSPPYKSEFTAEDNETIIQNINGANPDLLWIGMTAPKQEKWIYVHWDELTIHCHVGTIGAVFDFYAGTTKRAPIWWQNHSLEWLFRLLMEPKRMWKRYLIGNPVFLRNIFTEWVRR